MSDCSGSVGRLGPLWESARTGKLQHVICRVQSGPSGTLGTPKPQSLPPAAVSCEHVASLKLPCRRAILISFGASPEAPGKALCQEHHPALAVVCHAASGRNRRRKAGGGEAEGSRSTSMSTSRSGAGTVAATAARRGRGGEAAARGRRRRRGEGGGGRGQEEVVVFVPVCIVCQQHERRQH